ncbi:MULTISPECIES: hypothetical protein [unclassified Agarivorans]|uniref:hypothetical protein n=1 Tax=unclassified Agarivorans TaxID=2636026 RepID=UPI003D7E2B7E
MKIQGLGQPIPQQSKTQQRVAGTELSVATKATKGVVPWAGMDEQSVEKLRYEHAQGSADHAVSHYQDVANQLKRQQVNEMFGIDLFA